AESYGALKDLEALVDEFYEAAGLDPRRIPALRRAILEAAARADLDREGVFDPAADEDEAILSLDNYLCELKEMQIRDGLHVFGQAPEGRLLTDLAVAIARTPRGNGEGGDQSLLRALSEDLGLDFDPLETELAAPWASARPACLEGVLSDPWRTVGDTIERLEALSVALLDGRMAPEAMPLTAKVLETLSDHVLPSLKACGEREMAGLLTALDGRFLEPGPSGAPTRGRPDVLPTGRNFYSVDIRSVPTQTAWTLGWKSASLLVEDFRQREGMWPKAMTLSAWGTSNMRTGGDDIAQALALMGVRPKWDFGSRRVTGFEILPLAMLGRPRVDVTFRVSGFFRDAFPHQMDLLDSAARAIMALDEGREDNPAADRFRSDIARLKAEGTPGHLADLRAGSRVFGSKPGAYGAGLQAMIDEQLWHQRADLGETYLEWGSYAYGAGQEGRADRQAFEHQIARTDAIVQNQDNREHDLLDSDDYYQFEGGLAAAAETLQGRFPVIYHNDHSRPETPKIRTLNDEIGRVVRARAANPKWIAGMMRHGYKGAFEMAATLDYLFAFAATTDAVKSHHFDLLHAAYFADDEVRDFIETKNPAAFREMTARFLEAMERDLWRPRRNSLRTELKGLIAKPDNA
ncbi:MAG: cobaltochelatase subunit CobN, partial [Pseudomonadota bacterium]